MLGPHTLFLIVDDMPAVRMMIAGLLKKLGFKNIVEASDVVSGWTLISDLKSAFEVILVDWTMSGCSGADLIKRIKNSSRHQGIPVIAMLTQAELQANAKAAQSAGADEILTKPITEDELKQKLDAVRKKLARRLTGNK